MITHRPRIGSLRSSDMSLALCRSRSVSSSRAAPRSCVLYRRAHVIGLLSRFFALLSPESLAPIASVLGWVWYHLIPVRVQVAREGISRAFPEASREERERIVLGSLRHLIQSGLELFAVLRWSDERLLAAAQVPGLSERIAAAQAKGTGL